MWFLIPFWPLTGAMAPVEWTGSYLCFSGGTSKAQGYHNHFQGHTHKAHAGPQALWFFPMQFSIKPQQHSLGNRHRSCYWFHVVLQHLENQFFFLAFYLKTASSFWNRSQGDQPSRLVPQDCSEKSGLLQKPSAQSQLISSTLWASSCREIYACWGAPIQALTHPSSSSGSSTAHSSE